MSLNIVFAGTPDFARDVLVALANTHHHIQAIYTQPDRPAGRGRHLKPSPVKEWAIEHQVPVFQPQRLKDEKEQGILRDLKPDVLIVVAYGLILPQAILSIPKYGCINVHASLLPRWRGAAPIQHALLAGDPTTGITIMQMDAGLDTGDILLMRTCHIQENDTSESLYPRLATLGGEALIEALNLLEHGKLNPIKQNDTESTYATKLSKEEACLNWTKPADHLDRQIRAYNPWPVAYTSLKGETLRIWQATILSQTTQATPGMILETSNAGIDVATGNGILRLLELQLPGGKRLSAADLLHSKQELFHPGVQLGKSE